MLHRLLFTLQNLSWAMVLPTMTGLPKVKEIVDVEDSNILLDSEHQVVDLLGGYVITRLARQGKLSCADCQSSLLKSEQGIRV